MTPEEAKSWLNSLKETIGQAEYRSLWHYEQAINEIIRLLEEQIEKQTPKQPIKDELSCSGYVCPNCRSYINYTNTRCNDCGQLINWENKSNDKF